MVVTVNDYTKTGLIQAMLPLFKVMKLLGLYFTKSCESGSTIGDAKPCCRISPSQLYATLMLLIYWLNFFRHSTMFNSQDEFGLELCFKVLYFIYPLSNALGALCFYRACLNCELLQSVFVTWEKTVLCNKTKSLHDINSRCKVTVLTSGCILQHQVYPLSKKPLHCCQDP